MRSFLLFSASILLASAAYADPARDALSEVAKCADIGAEAERLACFDKAAGGVKTVLNAAAKQEFGQRDEEGGVLSWFGLTRPVTKPDDFGKPPAPSGPKELTEIAAAVLEFAKNVRGKALFVLDNGQVWRQIDGDTSEVRGPSADETMQVTIETAFMGSYSLRVKDRNGIVKVRRLK